MAEIAILGGTPAMHYRARTYFPELGRFGQFDPLEAGHRKYDYVGNSPTGAIDPRGLYWVLSGFASREQGLAALDDLARYTGRRVELGNNGQGPDVWFGGQHPRYSTPYSSSEDNEWIQSGQDDPNPRSIYGLWAHLTGGDEWHRERFREAWLGTVNQTTYGQQYREVTYWAYVQGLSFGFHQSPEHIQRRTEFKVSIRTQRGGAAVVLLLGGGSILLQYLGVIEKSGTVLWGSVPAGAAAGTEAAAASTAAELAALRAEVIASRSLLHQVFGKGVAGALERLANIETYVIPAGLTPQMLENYRRLIELQGLQNALSQPERLKLIEELLKKMAGR
jgi:hypothetical protein